MNKKSISLTAVLIFTAVLLLSACSKEEDKISSYLRESEVLVEDIGEYVQQNGAGKRKNTYADLSIPTQLTKVEDTYFIVDCYHNEVIYNDNLVDPISEWNILTDEMNMGHTLASDGRVYLVDDTENERIMVFEKAGDSYVFSQQFKNITKRPHYIVYNEADSTFYAWCSMSGEMYLFRHGADSNRMYLTDIRSIPGLDGIYVRSFTIIGDEIYFVSGNSSIIKADLKTFRILEEYPVPSEMAGMVQITPIEDEFYITISTDDNWDQNYATIIRCSSLEALSKKDYEDIYKSFIGGGTPYYITCVDGSYFLTEHRIPGHSIWRFMVENRKISAETVY